MDISKLIPLYLDLLKRPVSLNTTAVSQCVLKSFFNRLCNELNLSSLRLYLFNDSTGKVSITHLHGDRELWQNFDISKLRKERTVYKKLFFVKIRHIKQNGQFSLLGYLGFTTDEYVSKEILDALDVLCFLYGNYIVKKVVQSQRNITEQHISNIYNILSTNELPGTKTIKVISLFQKLTEAYKCCYCSVCVNTIFPEYISDKRKSSYLKHPKPICVSPLFIENLITSCGIVRYELSDLPRLIQNIILYNDKRDSSNFSCEIVPIFVDAEIIGLWLFCFSKYSPYDSFEISELINNLYAFNLSNYKFLFQRRFNKMIVNPIFRNRETRINPSDVFVIMPFTEQWSDDVWSQVISVAVNDLGMNPVRADNLYGQNIMEDVWTSILQSSIIICDTTNRNPNVFYELGIAHTLGKDIILLTQNIEDIPFDLQAYRHIVYKTTMTGGNKLRQDIKNFINEIKKQKTK